MTTTHPSALVGDPYATYDLPATSILWTATMVNFNSSQKERKKERKKKTLEDRATVYAVEVSTENSTIMTNSINSFSAGMKGQKLDYL